MNSDRMPNIAIAPESFAFLPPGTELRIDAESRSDGFFIELNSETVASIAHESAGHDAFGHSLGYAQDPTIGTLIRQLLWWFENDGVGGPAFAEGLMIAAAARALHRTRPDAEGLIVDMTRRQMARAVDFIETHLGGAVTIQDIASEIGMSPWHFQKTFAKVMGHPPHRYIMRRRTERAAELITATPLPLAQVAFTCGFSNQSHMGRAVKAIYGVTPRTMRRAES